MQFLTARRLILLAAVAALAVAPVRVRIIAPQPIPERVAAADMLADADWPKAVPFQELSAQRAFDQLGLKPEDGWDPQG